MSRSRRWAIRALLVLGGILAGLGLCAGHLNRNVVDGPTFAEHVDDLRRNDAVASQVGESIATQLVQSRPDLIALLPLVESVSVRVAGSDVLSPPVLRAAETAHLALTEPGADALVLRIADGGAVVAAVIAAVAPERAPAAADISVTLVSIGNQSFADDHDRHRSDDRSPGLAPAAGRDRLPGGRDPPLARPLAGRGAGRLGADGGGGRCRGGARRRWVADPPPRRGDARRRRRPSPAWQEFVRPLWWGVVALAVLGLATMLTVGSAVPDALGAQAVRHPRSLGRPTGDDGRRRGSGRGGGGGRARHDRRSSGQHRAGDVRRRHRPRAVRRHRALRARADRPGPQRRR